MARKVTISREVILSTALGMLIRDGYESVNIKTLASEIGCSTQPIAWHFENMEGLRRELAEYARRYADSKAQSESDDAVEAFEHMGRAYIRLAKKEPNLFRFLYLDNMRDIPVGAVNAKLADGIAIQTGLTREAARRCIQNTIVFTHGLATMVATGALRASEKRLMEMVNDASQAYVMNEKVKNNG